MVLTFGQKISDQIYIRREGAYGIAINELQQVALVKVPYGYHLPGGGMEKGESVLDCLKREFKEETGMSIEIINYLDDFAQYTVSARSARHLELFGHFYRVKIMGKFQEATDLDHELEWHILGDATKLLSLEYQAVAVMKAFENMNGGTING